ncbi:MAG: group II intron reverse transcriptase/maturase [Moorea sp. SIO4G2]|uniref:group II intron reverse transcriptase/maturase n=1 Tax=Moorena sp. SIO4A5 TaxID=2607838 RepID=UPI0013CC4C19|nr:group II intron reverse transcriptase/maturase [Moorena sp. SIO4A5]NEO24827.1 group II intron reverse transcriptase/maturase [Moorena sp. SIO4A5]NEO59725.1 group II intron reverse transcriptase/maturase [Moorena sp. SIO4G2]
MEKIEPNSKENGIVTEQTTDWHSINWKKAYREVRKLRRRIFLATREGNWKKVNKLQRLMLRSYSNILISVRQAAQINKGKNTPGIDKIANLNPTLRGELVDALKHYKACKPIPTKRVYIPKPNGKKRPLGIPGMIDRCIQGIVKNALEPHWEAKFEPSSYGFRPGRSTHDARQRIFNNIKGENNRKWWVLDADISGCFDNIAHKPLLETLGNFPAKKLIAQWLKAGYIDKNVFYESESGTPQGGIISPLLANIALQGIEEELGIKYKWRKDNRRKSGGFWENISKRAYIRFADDFVVLTENEEDAANAKIIIQEWLIKKGLKLSKEKTHIRHLTQGFDFLGWNFRKYQTTARKTGLVTLIKPSKKNIKKFKDNLKTEFKKLKSVPQDLVIKKLNPKIIGWGNYHDGVVAQETFNTLDNYIFWKLKRWGKRKHPNKSWKWISQKYFGKSCPGRDDKWVFGDKSSKDVYLHKLAWIPIKRHTLIQHTNSPDDPNLIGYWEERKAKQREKTAKGRFSAGKDKIANKQNYLCPVCNQPLGASDEIHIHHIIPKHLGGQDRNDNLVYLHANCHHSIHALGATNPDIQEMLRAGIKKPSLKRNKNQKVQTHKSKKRGGSDK